MVGTPPPLSAERLGGRAQDRLPVAEARQRILAACTPLAQVERVPARLALRRVVAEAVVAPNDVPPFDNVAMDGYAVRAEDVAAASAERPVRLQIIGAVAAGGPAATQPLSAGQAYRVLTGAPLPSGADTVVPYEYTDGQGFGGWSGATGEQLAAAEREVHVGRALPVGENVRYHGEDQRAGQAVVAVGTVVLPAVVGVLATLGQDQVTVYRRPRVAILSTGNEVVPITQRLGPGQIRDANSHSLAALCDYYGAQVVWRGLVRDDTEVVRRSFEQAVAAGADLVLTSGGVSLGEHDVVKAVLQQGGEVEFWAVDMRPGGPLTSGRFQGVPVLALPGNPVAVMVTFELFVRAALLRLAGHTHTEKVELYATALQPISNRSGKENFLRGVVERRLVPSMSTSGAGGDTVGTEAGADAEPEWVVRLTGEQGSGILTSVMKANCLVRLAPGQHRVPAGARVPVLLLDWPPLW